MSIKEALEILTQELIESHARCHYPYILTIGPASITKLRQPVNPDAGVYAQITSEVYGQIASASDTALAKALIQLCQELNKTREERWAKESHRKERSKHGGEDTGRH